MGIWGLTEFIEDSSYLEDFELQDTDLVIDGSNLCYHLLEYAHCNSVFGGDYDKFEQTVSDFFDHLRECNVKPLVLLHGGTCKSKIPVYLARQKHHIDEAFNASPENEEKGLIVPPLLLKFVFTQVLKTKDIPHAQCLMEADNSIAAVAKALNCPVLSKASYFYLYGVLYIPIDTFIHNAMNHLNDKRKTIPCKIYRLERLLNSFEGLNQHTLSLIFILMSNDNREVQQMVRSTVSLITEENETKYQGVPRGKEYVAKTLRWLCKYTLEDAITEIIKEVPNPMRLELLKIIETTINKYTNPFAEAFTHLSIPEECFASPTNELYRYKGNIETLPFKRVHKEENFRVVKQRQNYIMKMTNKLLKETQLDNDSVIDKLPQWFKYEYSMSNFPGTFVMMIQYHCHIFRTLVEDFSQPPSCVVAVQIFKIIFGLLTWVTENERKQCILNHVIRNRKSFVVDTLIGTTTVPLSDLRELSLTDRKAILDATLGIKNVQFIDELLPQWQLYIACLQYWKAHQISICDNCHIYSILTSMIYKLMVSKIGYYNSLSSFEQSNNNIIKFLENKRDKSDIKLEYSTNVTVAQACKEINSLDCLLAAPFFISHSQVKPDLSYGVQFNRDILHAFAQFQFSLAACIDLNALLGCPYNEPNIAMLYNGTLLYNLCVNFRVCDNMETYKNNIFKNSPSLLRAFNVLFKFLEK
ncbi:single-strand DNA endonuclease ASTE1-like [Halictus rubicundus]|uniref:single-strand DNA endonuclease ASTE1-like n=1 Tax=Halictus rubicundus TaxID=77578 RepID=UPI004036076A